MLEQIKIVIEFENSIEEKMNEFKLDVHGDNGSNHRIHIDEKDVIIELYDDDKLSSSRDLFYGRLVKNKVYIGRYQHIEAIEIDPIDVYDEFICTGTVL